MIFLNCKFLKISCQNEQVLNYLKEYIKLAYSTGGSYYLGICEFRHKTCHIYIYKSFDV